MNKRDSNRIFRELTEAIRNSKVAPVGDSGYYSEFPGIMQSRGFELEKEIFRSCSEGIGSLSRYFKANGKWGNEWDDQFEVMDALRVVFDGQFDPALFQMVHHAKYASKDTGVYAWKEKEGRAREKAGAVNSALALGILSMDEEHFLGNLDEFNQTLEHVVLANGMVDDKWLPSFSEESVAELPRGWSRGEDYSIDDTRDVVVALMNISLEAKELLDRHHDGGALKESQYRELEKLMKLYEEPEILHSVEIYLLGSLTELSHSRKRIGKLQRGSVKSTVDIGVSLLKYLRAREGNPQLELSIFAGNTDDSRMDNEKLKLGMEWDENEKARRKIVLSVLSYLSEEGDPLSKERYSLIRNCLESGYDPVRVALYNIQCWLVKIQNSDGGWGEDDEANSDLDSTSRVLFLLGSCSDLPSEMRSSSILQSGDPRQQINPLAYQPPEQPFILNNPLAPVKRDDLSSDLSTFMEGGTWEELQTFFNTHGRKTQFVLKAEEMAALMNTPMRTAAKYVIEQQNELDGGWSMDGKSMDAELTARIVGGLSYAIEDHRAPLYMDDLLKICARSAIADAFKERYTPKLNRIEFNVEEGEKEILVNWRIETSDSMGLSLHHKRPLADSKAVENRLDALKKYAEIRIKGARGIGSSTLVYDSNNTEEMEKLSIQGMEEGQQLYQMFNFLESGYTHGAAMTVVTNRNDIPYEMMCRATKRTEYNRASEHKETGYLGLDMAVATSISTSKLDTVTKLNVTPRQKVTDSVMNILLVAVDAAELTSKKECESIRKKIQKEYKRNGMEGAKFHLLYGEDATKKNILRVLHDEPVDIFHFAGHGRDDGEHTYLECYADDSDEKSHWISPMDLTPALHDEGGPPSLIFMNACNASNFSANHERTLVTDAVQGGVPAVIGMIYEIDNEVAQKAAEHIYHSYLIEGEAIGQAVRQARLFLHNEYDGIPVWGPLRLNGNPTARFSD